jgi:hypothetical protein
VVEDRSESFRVAIVSYQDLQFIDFTKNLSGLKPLVKEYAATPGQSVSAINKA